MPKGIVCQLNYHGGGFLRSLDTAAMVPFQRAPAGLLVGQTVTFSLRSAEATDVQIVEHLGAGPDVETRGG